jgi:voltage-dependent potassium channel beta subunit
MKYNRLGNTGLLVSELSFGSWVTFDSSGGDGKVVSKENASRKQAGEASFSIMKRAYEGGVNFFDNAEAYANGDAEILMGDAVQLGIKRGVWERSDLVLTTKIFFGARIKKTSMRMNRIGLSRKHITEGLMQSLERMQLGYVDVCFCHRPDPITPVEEVVRTFTDLINRGMCYYWGTSEWSATELMEAKAVADRLNLIPPVVEQPQYHLFARGRVEREYKPLYRNDTLGLGLTIWSPLASGVLTGKYRDGIPAGSRLASAAFKRRPDYNKRFLQPILAAERIRPIAEKLGCTMGQLALAWCMSNPDVSTVLTGATTLDQVDENIKACEYVDLITGKLKKEIDQALGDVLLRSSNSVSEAIDRVENQVHARVSSKVLSAGAISKL